MYQKSYNKCKISEKMLNKILLNLYKGQGHYETIFYLIIQHPYDKVKNAKCI